MEPALTSSSVWICACMDFVGLTFACLHTSTSEISLKDILERPVSLYVWENPGWADCVPHPVHHQDPPRSRHDRTVRLVIICLEIFCIFAFKNQNCYHLGPDSDDEERCGHHDGDHGGAVGHPIGRTLHPGVVVARQYPRLSPKKKFWRLFL